MYDLPFLMLLCSDKNVSIFAVGKILQNGYIILSTEVNNVTSVFISADDASSKSENKKKSTKKDFEIDFDDDIDFDVYFKKTKVCARSNSLYAF